MASTDVRVSHRTHEQGEDMDLRRDLDQELENPQDHMDSRLCFSLYFYPPSHRPLPLAFPASLYLAAFIEPSVQAIHRTSLALSHGFQIPRTDSSQSQPSEHLLTYGDHPND